MIVIDEKPFSVPTNYFGIGGSPSGYTLEYSADGETWTSWSEETPANETCFVSNVPKNCIYRLKDNSGEVKVQW